MTRAGKPELRERCWRTLEAAGAARFPGARGRIPNFVGAEAAARRLAETREWARARTVKCNPDSAQRPVRHAALRAGKRVFMAVPRVAGARPFLELDPARIPAGKLWAASAIKGASKLGRPLRLEDVPPVDLVVAGAVAVAPDGSRLGKGGGYSDLEYALLREHRRLSERTPVATTVHEVQVVARGAIPMAPHDVSLDLFATPERLVRCRGRRRRPPGILADALDDEKRRAIPALRERSR